VSKILLNPPNFLNPTSIKTVLSRENRQNLKNILLHLEKETPQYKSSFVALFVACFALQKESLLSVLSSEFFTERQKN
jgi:hypothetical protein